VSQGIDRPDPKMGRWNAKWTRFFVRKPKASSAQKRALKKEQSAKRRRRDLEVKQSRRWEP
jgi:hypothetical protein